MSDYEEILVDAGVPLLIDWENKRVLIDIEIREVIRGYLKSHVREYMIILLDEREVIIDFKKKKWEIKEKRGG